MAPSPRPLAGSSIWRHTEQLGHACNRLPDAEISRGSATSRIPAGAVGATRRAAGCDRLVGAGERLLEGHRAKGAAAAARTARAPLPTQDCRTAVKHLVDRRRPDRYLVCEAGHQAGGLIVVHRWLPWVMSAAVF